MAAASNEEINKAIEMWLYIQAADPSWTRNYVIKTNGGVNPFVPWPPEKEAIEKFLLVATEQYFRGEETKIVGNKIDPKKREELVNAFNEGYKIAEAKSAEARGAAKNRIDEVIKHALEEPNIDPNQKEVLFKALESESEKHPDKPIASLVPAAVELGEAAQPFLRPDIAIETQGPLSFSQIKALSPIQKAITAPFLDAITTVFPELKQGVMNKNFEEAFRKLIDVPERLTKLFGQSAVQSTLFQQMLASAKRAIPTGSTPGGAKTVVDDVVSSLFHHAPEPALVAYWELYQINIAQGLPPPSLAQFQASSMGLGSAAFHLGVNVAVSKARGAGLRWLAARAGLAAIPGPGWAAALLSIGAGLLGKVGGWLKKLPGIKEGLIPGDKEILAVGCGAILLIFFILPIVSQLNIDSSLVTRLNPAGGGPTQNQYLDVSITATPASSVGGRPTAMRYTVSVKPKGPAGSFAINSADVTFSVYGGSGCPDLTAPPISPGSLSGGSFTFTVPLCPGLQDSVVTATFSVNANVGSATGVSGSDSVSTVIGNPATGCFVFGGAGQHDGYGHVSSTWDSTAAVTAAIGVLSRAPAYMAQVCAGGQPVTIYRVNANFGGGSTSPPNSIFMYNACATTACATYTLAHETGHIVDTRTGLFDQYNALGIYAREGPLWTYPNAFSEHEDFAETLGAYVVWHNYVWGARHGHSGGTLNYAGQYPLHYNFAKSVFGGIEY